MHRAHGRGVKVGKHAVQVHHMVGIAQRIHRPNPRLPQQPVAGIHHVLGHDDVVAVELGEAHHIPHRGAGTLGRGVHRVLFPQVHLPLPPLHALGHRMVRAFRRRNQDVGRKVPPGVGIAHVRAIVVRVGKIRVVRLNGQCPMVHGQAHV